MTFKNDKEGVFTGIVGHQGAKAVLRGALRAGDVDVLLVGPPATGKSLMLRAIDEQVPKVVYRDCKRFTAPRLSKTFAADPPILLLDELDALDSDAWDVLSNPMEHGHVTDDTDRETINKEVKTQVIAAANSTKRLPDNIRSRFRIVEVTGYNREEAREVAKITLPEEIGWVQGEEDAAYVADVVYESSESTDPRDYRDVAKMADGKGQVETMAAGIIDAEADIESNPITVEEISVAQEEVGKRKLTDAVKQEKEKADRNPNSGDSHSQTRHRNGHGAEAAENGEEPEQSPEEEAQTEMDHHVREELAKTLSEEQADKQAARNGHE